MDELTKKNGDKPSNSELVDVRVLPKDTLPSFKPPASGSDTRTWRKYMTLKHWSSVLLLALFAAAVVWGLLRFADYMRERNEDDTANSYRSTLNGEYGGTTARETFEMFIGALQEQRYEEAVRYFVSDKQEQWRHIIARLHGEERMAALIDELRTYREAGEITAHNDTETRFTYTFDFDGSTDIMLPHGEKDMLPAGTYEYEVIFVRAEGGIWKIAVL